VAGRMPAPSFITASVASHSSTASRPGLGQVVGEIGLMLERTTGCAQLAAESGAAPATTESGKHAAEAQRLERHLADLDAGAQIVSSSRAPDTPTTIGFRRRDGRSHSAVPSS
jgi:hypothetical protein